MSKIREDLDLGQDWYLLWGNGGTSIVKGTLYKMELKDSAVTYSFRLLNGGSAWLYSHQLNDKLFKTLTDAENARCFRGIENNPNVVLQKPNGYGYVYAVRVDRYIKIGITVDPTSRFKEYTKLMGDPVLVCMYPFKNAGAVEDTIHGMFEKNRKRGEWFFIEDRIVIEAIKRMWEEQNENR